jgi:hypothetical protein
VHCVFLIVKKLSEVFNLSVRMLPINRVLQSLELGLDMSLEPKGGCKSDPEEMPL